MRHIRIARVAAAVGLLVALTASAGPVAAGNTTAVTVTRGIALDITAFGASRTCGFPIELHTVGMEVSIRHYGADGSLIAESLVQHYDGYLLNPANGKTLSSKVSGPERWVYAADGSYTDTTTGATTRTAPRAGLVSGFIGRDFVRLVPTGEVDEDGNLVYEPTQESFTGQFLGNAGVCAILA